MIEQQDPRPADPHGDFAGEWKGEERRSRLRRRTDGQDRSQRRIPVAETLAIARRDWARGSYLLG